MANAPQLNLDVSGSDAREAWEATLELARERAGKPTFESWLQDLKLKTVSEHCLVIAAPSDFKRTWVEKKYKDLLADCAEAAFGWRADLQFQVCDSVDATNCHASSSEKALTGKSTGSGSRRGKPQERVPDEAFFGTVPLNERYTFDTFVVGAANRLAHAGAVAAARNPGSTYNPLFLYGGAGLGKTHLMHALGRSAKEGKPDRRVAYLSAETFTSQYVTAIRERKMDEFRRKYRHADIWLVDDIQFIADKERTEEEFFHTFNTLRDMGKQIVLTSDRAPKDLNLDERLRSRFEAGLIADIRQPDLETRLAILQNKASVEGKRLPDDVLMYMAELIQSNIRVLEGALIKLLAYASITSSPITRQLAGDVLGTYFTRGPKDRSITPDDVKRMVAEAFSVTVADIDGTSRTKGIVLARQVAMHLTRELTGASLPEIGRAFGGKDHTTVVHSCGKIKTLIKSDIQLAQHIASLMTDLQKLA